ncbi:MAG: DUF2794 domain-containing protein [Hyphomicrobiales bacterium]|uniref:DUF2794 domain-containing protein n=1 Tax=Rhabdaerophilum calidifontis TaxID=2604328 RepID=UPI001239F70C|nr:DUF2794 domain-containing protein [Rhabdaerophilum calidifontis]MCA1951889.1 DUF2794 domain-containing protein [Hyphomicrobiales bacterium]MCA2000114.1 DUF2794 domain-containing protein [Hyphomicrobiales bacterium]
MAAFDQGTESEAAIILPFPRSHGNARAVELVRFDRRELSEILRVYGRHVATGEWRDYAIEFGRERAIFAILKRSGEMPLYRVIKEPARAARQGAYSVVAAGGAVLKRGEDLARVLNVIDKPARIVG